VLNARDFYDPLLFGRPIHNEMILARYQTPIDLSFTAIYIPVFRPARLPTTAPAAFAGGATVANARDQSALADLQAFQGAAQQNLGFPIQNAVIPVPNPPPFLIQNGTAAAKVNGSFLNIDASLSYAYTHWDLPMPKSATVNTVQTRENPSQLLPSRVDTTTQIELVYPRYHMVGADFSTSIEPLGGLGLFIPETNIDLAINYGADADQALLKSLYGKDLPCNDQRPCAVLKKQPFVKATVGMDYTIAKWLYVNAQYLYGFVDEFGADYLKHYLVATIDIRPFGDQYTLRLAGVVNLASNASAVAFPALILKPYPGLELYLGGLIFLGGANDKFGKPENGSTQVFFRARFSF
jgi:hypothetical protein